MSEPGKLISTNKLISTKWSFDTETQLKIVILSEAKDLLFCGKSTSLPKA